MRWYATAPDKACWLAWTEASATPVGFIEASLRNVVDGCLSSPVGYIEGIYVVPPCRGRGAGRSLLAAAAAWCRERGCTELATDALADDESAQRFHRRMGFTETYRVVQFKKPI